MSCIRNVLAWIAAAAALVISSEGRAQDFFDTLFGPASPSFERGVGGDYSYSATSDERGLHAGRSWKQRVEKRRAELKSGSKQTLAVAANVDTEASSGHGFCVRTCDGYYFPLITSGRATKQQSCEYACPSAPMAVYEGSTIETAQNLGGEKYTSLSAAFSFRDKTTQNCSCNPPEHAQSFSMRLLGEDLSLRTGDIVFGDHGAFVYQGSKFVPFERSSLLSSGTRAKIRALLVEQRMRPEADPRNTYASEAIQAVRGEAKDAVRRLAPVGGAETPQTVDVAPKENFSASLFSVALIFIIGAGILTSAAKMVNVVMKKGKPGAPAKRLERLAKL